MITQPGTIDHVIRLLERARIGSRELDCRIYVARGLRPSWLGTEAVLYTDFSGMPLVRFRDGDGGAHRSKGHPSLRDEDVPRFTTSIDAALTLYRPEEGSNEASFLHAALWQRRLGDIPLERIPPVVCGAALRIFDRVEHPERYNL